MGDSQEETVGNYQQGKREALYAKARETIHAEDIPVDTSEDGFADAMNKLNGEEEVSLDMVRDKQEEPAESAEPENPAAEALSTSEGEEADDDYIDPALAEAGYFYQDGELCTTVNIYGEEHVVSASALRRGYQTEQAAQRKFQDAARLMKQAKELAESRKKEAPAEPKVADTEAEIRRLYKEANQAMLEGDDDRAFELEEQMNALRSKKTTAPEPSPAPAPAYSQEDVSAVNAWFAGQYPEIQANDDYLSFATDQFAAIQKEREDYGLAPLSLFDLAREAGDRTERYLRAQGIQLERVARTQQRRNADSPPNPVTVAQRRSSTKQGTTVISEAELSRKRANDVADRARQQRERKMAGIKQAR